jgi:hypothetical protein
VGLRSSQTIASWGDNGSGQLDVPSPNNGFVAIAAVGSVCLGLTLPSEAAAVEDQMPHGVTATEPLSIISVNSNPVTASAEILFEARTSGPVIMTILDAAGRHRTTTALGSFTPGRHRVRFCAQSTAELRMASGVYFVQLRGAGGHSSAARLLLIR